MAHRLIALVCRADRILKNGFLTENFNRLARVQPRYLDFRQFLSQSSVHFSDKPRRTNDKPMRPNQDSNSSGYKMKEKDTTGKKKIDKRTNNPSSSSPPKSTPKAPNQGAKLDGNAKNASGAGNGKKKSRRPVVHKYIWTKLYAAIASIIIVIMGLVNNWRFYWEVKHTEITWKDFAEIYLAQGRVSKVEVINNNWLKVHTAPGTSADGAKTFLLRLDSLNAAPVIGIGTLGVKVEVKNEAPVVGKKMTRK